MNRPAIRVAQGQPDRRHRAEMRLKWISAHSTRNGLIAALAMTAFYTTVVWAASGSWQHFVDQARQDWIYLAAIIGGFATQVTLTSEIRHRHQLTRGTRVAGAAGAGASTAGMVACCAHHLADLLPLIGAATAAGFLTDNRIAFMLVGITINAIAIAVAAYQLRRIDQRVGRC